MLGKTKLFQQLHISTGHIQMAEAQMILVGANAGVKQRESEISQPQDIGAQGFSLSST